MLGKLYKHELKAQYKMYLGIYAIILLFTGMSCLSGNLSDLFDNVFFNTIYVTTLTLSILGLIAMFFITMILSVVRYYNNLIKDEGYLMHTLPVPSIYHHLVKLTTPLVWFLADIVILFLAVTIMLQDWKFEWLKMFEVIIEQSGVKVDTGFVIQIAVYALLMVLSSLSLFYACLNVGSLSPSNKGVMAFVAYIVFYIVNQVISMISMIIFIVILAGPGGDVIAFLESDTVPDGYFSGTMTTALIVSVLYLVLYNVISGYIITKKVNLE